MNLHIIYLCLAINTPVGGIKVIVRHSQIINSLENPLVKSSVHFPEDPSFNITWFDHQADIKRDTVFNRQTDLVIVPEVWALKFGEKLLEQKIRYGIFVQNGYLIFQGAETHSLERLKNIYSNASIILSISKDTTQCIKLAFPDLKIAIKEVQWGIDRALFNNIGPKENIISYMPRKLAHHSANVVAFLRLQKLGGWSIVPIHNMGEKEVAALLARSKIFLSFSELEGLALPPVEAALSGNLVIGYTGEGCKQYWLDGVFTEIENGNIRKFVATVLDTIKLLSVSNYDHRAEAGYAADITKLSSICSQENELKTVSEFVDSAVALWKNTQVTDSSSAELFSRAEKAKLASKRIIKKSFLVRRVIKPCLRQVVNLSRRLSAS